MLWQSSMLNRRIQWVFLCLFYLISTAVIFCTHTHADVPFPIGFGYSDCYAWVLRAANICPVTFAVMKAVCNTVGHTFRCAKPISHTNGLSTVSTVVVIIDGAAVECHIYEFTVLQSIAGILMTGV